MSAITLYYSLERGLVIKKFKIKHINSVIAYSSLKRALCDIVFSEKWKVAGTYTINFLSTIIGVNT